MTRSYYADTVDNFLNTNSDEIIGKLAKSNDFSLEQSQRDAWIEEIKILKSVLVEQKGSIYFEYSIPRMGKRIDVVLLIGSVIFVLEFKIGEHEFTSYAIDQVCDYALDLKNFHETSHDHYIAPILIATKADQNIFSVATTPHNDKLLIPIKTNTKQLGQVIESVLQFSEDKNIDNIQWEKGRYCPTPTIIEAAMALYNHHSVAEISRNDASAINLSKTSEAVSAIINSSRKNKKKSICFVTGVPGAGKTLVGLNIATTHIDKKVIYTVFIFQETAP